MSTLAINSLNQGFYGNSTNPSGAGAPFAVTCSIVILCLSYIRWLEKSMNTIYNIVILINYRYQLPLIKIGTRV